MSGRMKLNRPRREKPVKQARSLDLAALRDALEIACVDAMRGDPPGPYLARTLERTCASVLRARGLHDAHAVCESTIRGTVVRVVVPEDGPRVARLVLTFGT